MLHICITELFAHSLIQICRIVGTLSVCASFSCVSAFPKSANCISKDVFISFRKALQNFFICIFLAFRHGINQCIQRVIHLLELRCNNFFKTVCPFLQKTVLPSDSWQQSHSSGLQPEASLILSCAWHDICTEFIKKQLKILCKRGIFTLHSEV